MQGPSGPAARPLSKHFVELQAESPERTHQLFRAWRFGVERLSATGSALND